MPVIDTPITSAPEMNPPPSIDGWGRWIMTGTIPRWGVAYPAGKRGEVVLVRARSGNVSRVRLLVPINAPTGARIQDGFSLYQIEVLNPEYPMEQAPQVDTAQASTSQSPAPMRVPRVGVTWDVLVESIL